MHIKKELLTKLEERRSEAVLGTLTVPEPGLSLETADPGQVSIDQINACHNKVNSLMYLAEMVEEFLDFACDQFNLQDKAVRLVVSLCNGSGIEVHNASSITLLNFCTPKLFDRVVAAVCVRPLEKPFLLCSTSGKPFLFVLS